MLTNDRRSRWCDCVASCAACECILETNLHAIRDCVEAKKVWLLLLPDDRKASFFEEEKWQWLLNNLKWDPDGCGLRWSLVFGVACWKIWKWRNCKIFYPLFTSPEEPDQVILWWSNIIYNVCSATNERKSRDLPGVDVLVKWLPPETGWVEVNTDASVNRAVGEAACGGLIRDVDGRWIYGFANKVGHLSGFKTYLEFEV